MDTNFFRVAVIDVIFDPMAILRGISQYRKYYSEIGIKNPELLGRMPRNSIIGKRILNENGTEDGMVEIFFPFFPPHMSLPVKPGEHVWAFIESGPNIDSRRGYWMCRITEQWYVDDVNHTHAPREWEPSYFKTGEIPKFDFQNGIVYDSIDGKRKIKKNSEVLKINNFVTEDAYRSLVKQDNSQVNSSRLTPFASVPRFKKRPGDLALEGSNNTLIVLGTNRKKEVAKLVAIPIRDSNNDLYTISSPDMPNDDMPFGCIDLVSGRGYTQETSGDLVVNTLGMFELNKSPQSINRFRNEGDPDLKFDKSRIRISEKTKVDVDLGISDFNGNNFSIYSEESGAIIVKSDKIRLIARKDLEILVSDNEGGNGAAIVIKNNGDIVFKPSANGYIKLGSDSANKAIMCTDLPATATGGSVSASPVFTTGNDIVCTSQFGQGTFARKILVD